MPLYIMLTKCQTLMGFSSFRQIFGHS
uniref:Uncharacterized protein n=1 Tax=Anguilla anguilla TaxID=7936 RepID=A0A0E9QS83_ANGAN